MHNECQHIFIAEEVSLMLLDKLTRHKRTRKWPIDLTDQRAQTPNTIHVR